MDVSTAEMWNTRVTLKQADLRDVGVGDYHVVVSVGSQATPRKTASARRSSTPVWDRTFDVSTPLHPSYVYGFVMQGRKKYVRVLLCVVRRRCWCVVWRGCMARCSAVCVEHCRSVVCCSDVAMC
jgi:hypothetical protein